MIGNDVVDLALAKTESNWQRKGFLEKIFTENEQKLIKKSRNKSKLIWILWSRKEAVYKIILQQNGIRGYYPIKIENINFEKGLVSFENKIYFTKTQIIGNEIHSTALTTPNFENIFEIYNETKIIKHQNIPYLIENNQYYNISKSHHGKYEKIVGLIQ